MGRWRGKCGLWRVRVRCGEGERRCGWWVGESEENRREEVECDQSLPPQPAVISVGLNVCPSLRVVVKVTQLHGGEIGENIHLFSHPLHVWLNEWREA